MIRSVIGTAPPFGGEGDGFRWRDEAVRDREQRAARAIRHLDESVEVGVPERLPPVRRPDRCVQICMAQRLPSVLGPGVAVDLRPAERVQAVRRDRGLVGPGDAVLRQRIRDALAVPPARNGPDRDPARLRRQVRGGDGVVPVVEREPDRTRTVSGDVPVVVPLLPHADDRILCRPPSVVGLGRIGHQRRGDGSHPVPVGLPRNGRRVEPDRLVRRGDRNGERELVRLAPEELVPESGDRVPFHEDAVRARSVGRPQVLRNGRTDEERRRQRLAGCRAARKRRVREDVQPGAGRCPVDRTFAGALGKGFAVQVDPDGVAVQTVPMVAEDERLRRAGLHHPRARTQVEPECVRLDDDSLRPRGNRGGEEKGKKEDCVRFHGFHPGEECWKKERATGAPLERGGRRRNAMWK